jgi:DNA-directed RNA polymerase sigma subunit (sigma70/sigma32)
MNETMSQQFEHGDVTTVSVEEVGQEPFRITGTKDNSDSHRTNVVEDALDNVFRAQSSPNVRDIYNIEARELPLLTKEEEQKLAGQVRRGNKAREQLQSAQPDSDQRQLLDEQVRQGEIARDYLIRSNLRLVFFYSQKVSNSRHVDGRSGPGRKRGFDYRCRQV